MTAKRAAWIITWDWFGDTRKPRNLMLHILQPRWKVSRVLEHMKFLYLNSELFLVSERLRFLSEKAWRGLIHQEGPRIIIGDNPILVGSWVHDLRIEPISVGQQIVRWTQPAGLRFQPGSTKIETLGQPTELALEVSTTGQVSELHRKILSDASRERP
jgi:hypothetical protein